jgi:hypothetical protein
MYQSEAGKYRVTVSVGRPTIEARREDSPFYVKQSLFIENVIDLENLFIAIGSVLDQVHNEDQS